MNTTLRTATPRSRRSARRALAGLGLVLALGATACGSDASSGGIPSSGPSAASREADVGPSTGTRVEIERSRYAPLELRVAAGTTVEFENLDAFAHTVTSREGSALEYDSGLLNQNETFEQTFDEAGEYAYFCEIHPTMRATVTVTAS